jgi:hypothetical protein
MFETNKQKTSIQRWSRLAIQLNGAAESGRCDHITPATIATELEHDRVFQFLEHELPAKVWRTIRNSFMSAGMGSPCSSRTSFT